VAHVEHRPANKKPWAAIYPKPTNKSGKGCESFKRKVDAERFLAVTLAAQLKREWIDPDAGKITLREYADRWVETRAVRESTRRRYRTEVVSLGAVGAVPLGKLTASIMEQWQAGLLQRMKASTVTTYRATVSSVLGAAVRDRLIAANPLREVKKPGVTRKRVTPMDRATVEQIHDDITPWYAAAVYVGAGCGLRRGETFALTVDRVDFLRRRVTVDRTLVRVKGGLGFGPPKTRASTRDVPLPAFVADALAAHIARYGVGDGGLIFRTRGGKPVDSGALAASWRRVAPAGSRFHDLRHHYASTLIAAGASVVEVQEALGHGTSKETLDTYTHLFKGSEDRTRARIDAAWAPVQDSAPSGEVEHGQK
jgi:integrase